MIGVAVVGFGMIGHRHAAAYLNARKAGLPVELRMICSRHGSEAASAGGNLAELAGDVPLDPDRVRLTGALKDVLEDDTIQAVSVCTWTDTHVDIAVRALVAGKHVLVEKPAATRAERILPLLQAAARAKTLCVPAMVMRWWPGWPWLRDQIKAGTFGAVRSASFLRVGAQPDWARFYSEYERSGGALVDLHVHDVDFLRWCFGDPAEVSSLGNLSRVTSLYRYQAGPPHAAIEGGWTRARGVSFKMRYAVEFDEAVADFDVSRDPAVLLTWKGETTPVTLPGENPYDAEVADFVRGALEGRTELRATMADAYGAARIIDAERRSLETGRPATLSAEA
jgi:predicted dehydrogenase